MSQNAPGGPALSTWPRRAAGDLASAGSSSPSAGQVGQGAGKSARDTEETPGGSLRGKSRPGPLALCDSLRARRLPGSRESGSRVGAGGDPRREKGPGA